MWFVFSLHSMSPDYFYNKTKEEQEPKMLGLSSLGFGMGGAELEFGGGNGSGVFSP